MRSVRSRVTALAMAASLVLLGVVSLVVVVVLHRQLTDNLDEGLGQRTDAIAVVLRGGDLPDAFGDEDLLVQVVGPDGLVVEATRNLDGRPPIGPPEPGLRTVSDVPGRTESFRVLTRPFDRPAGSTLRVGVNVDDVSDPVGIVTRLLLVGVPVVVVALGAVTWWLTGRTLAPVERIRSRMADVTARRLDQRVPEPGTGDEIDGLARTVNDALDRLEDAVRRQNRFVADASHELRGPLTRIRAELEVDLARPGSPDRVAAEQSVLEETLQLQRLVDDLLLLARSDAVPADPPDVAVDLDDVVLREARRLRERGRVRVDAARVGAALVSGDRTQLGRAVRNLLDNAERHAAETVTLSLVDGDGLAVLTVEDDGAGIPAGDRAAVFDRFTRLDEARTRDAGGSGLGLAITRDIVEGHGGTVTLGDGPPTRFTIRLPARR